MDQGRKLDELDAEAFLALACLQELMSAGAPQGSVEQAADRLNCIVNDISREAIDQQPGSSPEKSAWGDQAQMSRTDR